MKLFNAITRQAPVIGKGTVSDLVVWLEKYINIVFPEHSIDYWNVSEVPYKNMLIGTDAYPGDIKIHHFACYAYQGSNEGYRVSVGYVDSDCNMQTICSLKMFGSSEMAWQIAAAITEALFSIYFYQETPTIVDLYDTIPRKRVHSLWSRETTLTHPVEIQASQYAIKVTSGDTVLSDIVVLDFNDSHRAESLKKDWITLLTNMDIKFSLVEDAPNPA